MAARMPRHHLLVLMCGRLIPAELLPFDLCVVTVREIGPRGGAHTAGDRVLTSIKGNLVALSRHGFLVIYHLLEKTGKVQL